MRTGFFGKGSRAQQRLLSRLFSSPCCQEVTTTETRKQRWRCASHNSYTVVELLRQSRFSRTGFLYNTWTDPDATSFSDSTQIGYIYIFLSERGCCSCVFSEWLHFYVYRFLFFFRIFLIRVTRQVSWTLQSLDLFIDCRATSRSSELDLFFSIIFVGNIVVDWFLSSHFFHDSFMKKKAFLTFDSFWIMQSSW